MKLCTKIA